MVCFQSVLYCIVLYNDVFTFLYVAVGNKLLLLLLLLETPRRTKMFCRSAGNTVAVARILFDTNY